MRSLPARHASALATLQRHAPILQLHLATLLFGTAGVIGRATALSPLTLVEARSGLGALVLLCVAWARKVPFAVKPADGSRLIALGLLLAFHWYSFFNAIRLSGVAIGLLSFSTFPIFIVLIAPYVDGKRIRKAHLLLIPVMLLGLSLMAPVQQGDWQNAAGAGWGVASGLTFALVQIMGRILVRRHSPIKISAYQNAVAALVLLPLMTRAELPTSVLTIAELLFLGIFCTALAHTLFIAGMRTVSASTVSMFTYLEPVYGCAMAALLLHEIPTVRTVAGGVVILLAAYAALRTR